MYQPAYMGLPPTMLPQQTQMQMSGQQQTQPQPQQNEVLNNGGLVVVPTEDDVKKYPVAPGNCVTFKIENQPVIMEKSMSRSQFASPHYERYKLLKEDIGENAEASPPPVPIQDNSLGEIKKNIEHISSQIGSLKDGYSEIIKMLRGYNPQKKNREEGKK